MTPAEAIRIAQKRVTITAHARGQYSVQSWNANLNAWRMSNMMDRRAALTAAYERKISLALELLGFSNDDAGALANSASWNAYPKDWRQVVRDEIKADKLASENAA